MERHGIVPDTEPKVQVVGHLPFDVPTKITVVRRMLDDEFVIDHARYTCIANLDFTDVMFSRFELDFSARWIADHRMSVDVFQARSRGSTRIHAPDESGLAAGYQLCNAAGRLSYRKVDDEVVSLAVDKKAN